MENIKSEIEKMDPLLGSFLVPDCVYRQGCHEFQSCGYPANKYDIEQTIEVVEKYKLQEEDTEKDEES